MKIFSPFSYLIGSFVANPDFLGYFFGVAATFFIFIKLLVISESGQLNFTSSSIFPPSKNTAFLDSSNSSSTFPDLYGTKYPPRFT